MDSGTNFHLRFFLTLFLFLFIFKKISFYFTLWPRHAACGILVPRLGIEAVPPAVEAQSLNHWTAREVHEVYF